MGEARDGSIREIREEREGELNCMEEDEMKV